MLNRFSLIHRMLKILCGCRGYLLALPPGMRPDPQWLKPLDAIIHEAAEVVQDYHARALDNLGAGI